MGRRYDGRDQAVMQEQIQRSRDFIDTELERRFPNHINWFHVNFQGLHYHFYTNRNRAERPARLTIDFAVREVRDELFHLELDRQDQLQEYFMPDGTLAARIQVFNMRIELEDMPPVQVIYRHLLHFGHRQPQFANIIVVLE